MYEEEYTEYVGTFFLDILREEAKKIRDAIIDGYMTEDEGVETLRGFVYNTKIPMMDELINDIVSTFINLIDSLSFGYIRAINSISNKEDIDRIRKVMAIKIVRSLAQTCTSYLVDHKDTDIKAITKQLNRSIAKNDDDVDDVVINVLKEYWARLGKSRVIVTDTVMDFTHEIHESLMKDITKEDFANYDSKCDEILMNSVMDHDIYNDDDECYYYTEEDEIHFFDSDSITINKLSSNINVKPLRGFNTYYKKHLF